MGLFAYARRRVSKFSPVCVVFTKLRSTSGTVLASPIRGNAVAGLRFYLADETGTVLMDVHAAEYDLPVGSTREVNSYQGTATSAPVTGSGGITAVDRLRYVSYAQIRGATERVGQFIDKRIEKTGASANPQVEAKQEALKELFAALPAMAQGGQPSTDVMAKLTAASGPLSDPEKEQRRQMFLAHLQEVESLRQGGNLPAMKMPLAQPATGRYRLREYLVVPGQEYLISGTCGENSTAAGAPDLGMIGKGQHEPTFVISTRAMPNSTAIFVDARGL